MFELLVGYFASSIEISLADHVTDIIVGELGVPHFMKDIFEAIESDVLWIQSFEDLEAFLDMLFGCDGQHHPESV